MADLVDLGPSRISAPAADGGVGERLDDLPEAAPGVVEDPPWPVAAVQPQDPGRDLPRRVGSDPLGAPGRRRSCSPGRPQSFSAYGA